MVVSPVLMTIRTTLLMLLVASACSSPKQKDVAPAPGVNGVSRADLPADAAPSNPARPATPVDVGNAMAPAPSPALRAALALDGPGAPTSVDPTATARFAAVSSLYDDKHEDFVRRVQVYRVTGGALTVESEAALPEGDVSVADWVWQDADRIVLLYADGSLATYAAGVLTPIPRPDKKLFKVKPPGRDASLDRFDRDEGLVATGAGDVWLHHCVRGWSGDDDPCERYVFVRVTGKPIARSKAPKRRASHPGLASPPGWSMKLQPTSGLKTGAILCKGPSVEATLPAPEDSVGYSLDDAAWLSVNPPIMMVFGWYPGMDDASPSTRFITRCTAPDYEPGIVERGPDGFWLITDTEAVNVGSDAGTVLLWHGRIVATVPGLESVTFAP